jgi:uncharacterized membrane protein
MDLELFVGRFHPLIVHFPIALLILAVLIEFVSKASKFEQLSSSLPFILLLGAVTAIVSVIMGWFIANDRGYDDGLLEWHRWLGVSVLILSLFLTLVSVRIIKISKVIRIFFFVLLFLLISLTGHLGGSLTHGENYLLEKAPEFLRNRFIEEKPANLLAGLSENPDSVIVFRDMILPLLTAKCTPCHNDTQKKGKLVLTSKEGIEAGGDGGPAIRGGKALESELFRRISLPPEHEKFMPLKETPLSFSEVSLIAWWINEGASFETPLSVHSISQIKELLIRDFEYNPSKKPYYETVKLEKADSLDVEKLRQLGFKITPLAQDNNFLSVSVVPKIKEVNLGLLKELLAIKENITWLDLGDKQISDNHLEIISQFSSLTKLNLNNNPLSDKNLAVLTELRHLEILNLFNTEVGDEGLKLLENLPSLKTIYLWHTKVTPSGIDQLKNSHKDLVIDTGSKFSAVPLLE